MRSKFSSNFFAVYGMTLVPLFLGLSLFWQFYKIGLPQRPPLPIWGETYISDYSGVGSAAHYIYLYGLFGWPKIIKKCNLILLGSSHVELGLSAADLETEIRKTSGLNNTKVYNLGLAFADGFGFDSDIIEKQGLNNRAVVVDLFMPLKGNRSEYGEHVWYGNGLSAYIQVFQLWLTIWSDWLIDPIIPRFYLEYGLSAIQPHRFLLNLSTRTWAHGDIDEFWSPVHGLVSQNPTATMNVVYGAGVAGYTSMDNRGVAYLPDESVFLHAHQLQAVYTLVPYEGFEKGIVPKEASPFVALSPNGLTFYEGMHLNAGGRALVTKRLFESLTAQGFVRSLEDR